MRSGMMGNYHVPFWRAAALVRESLTLIISPPDEPNPTNLKKAAATLETNSSVLMLILRVLRT
jgi:hypothetical protein